MGVGLGAAMIDSHTHLFLCERPEAELVADALAAGVTRMLNVGLGGEQNAAAIGAAERHEEVFASVGRHPTEASGFDDAEAERIAQARRTREGAGDRRDRDRLLPRDCEPGRPAARLRGAGRDRPRARLPIVIHGRDKDGETTAIDEIFEVLDAQAGETPVILHCFSPPGAPPTPPSAAGTAPSPATPPIPGSDELREAAAQLPAELVLVETDAPYLAPQTVRGKPNEPAYVVDTARVVAAARGVSYEELERTVEANARTLFGW